MIYIHVNKTRSKYMCRKKKASCRAIIPYDCHVNISKHTNYIIDRYYIIAMTKQTGQERYTPNI